MNSKSKIISILMAAVMAVTLFAAYGGGNVNSYALAAENSASADSDFAGYPMDGSTTLSFWLWGGPQLHASVSTYQDSPFHTGLSEMTGVNIEWMFPPPGETNESQQFNLLIASGNVPDIVFSGLIMKDAQRFIDERVFRDLTPYIEDYSPNYYAYLKSDPARDKAFKTDNSLYYGYGFFREDGGWNDTYQGPLIRQDWLDEQGLETPKTISDWDTTLRSFKENYNAVFVSAWSSRFYTGSNICGAFGAFGGMDYRIYIDQNDNKAKLAQVAPEWKNYVEQLNKWWADGLIDQDILSTDDAAARAKVLNGETGFTMSSMGQLSNWVIDAEEAGNGANWVGLDYPSGDDGTKSIVFGGPGIGGTATCISTNVGDDRLEAAMRLLDYAYSPEGFMYWNYGKEGVSWTMGDNGKPEFTDLLKNDPDGLTAIMEKYSGTIWNGPNIQATDILHQRNKPQAIAANDLWFYSNPGITAHYVLPRGFSLSADESTRVEEIEGPMKTYIEETAVKFMTGTEPISNFDNFVATVESMGLDELLSIYQAAYERYMVR